MLETVQKYSYYVSQGILSNIYMEIKNVRHYLISRNVNKFLN